jgi:hypothetical protein
LKAVSTAVTTPVVGTVTDLELVNKLSCRGSTSISGRVHRGSGSLKAVAIVVTAPVVGTVTDLEIIKEFTTRGSGKGMSLPHGKSNDRSNGSSSKNECSG